MVRKRRLAAAVVMLLTLGMLLLPSPGLAADGSNDVASGSAVADVEAQSLPECGPERDGEIREYFGALWQCTYFRGHWKWIAIGCSGCLAERETAFLPARL
jgi:hypothetical protein